MKNEEKIMRSHGLMSCDRCGLPGKKRTFRAPSNALQYSTGESSMPAHIVKPLHHNSLLCDNFMIGRSSIHPWRKKRNLAQIEVDSKRFGRRSHVAYRIWREGVLTSPQ